MKFVLFCHSLASCWNHGNAHFLRGIVRELIQLRNNVVVYEPADGWSRHNLLRDHGTAALEDGARVVPGVLIRSYEHATLDLEAALDGANVVFVHEWTDRDLIARLGAYRLRGGRFQLLFHDTHHRAVTSPAELDRFDLTGYDAVLAFGEVLREVYLARGWSRRVFTWHEAADTPLFRMHPHACKDTDLIWIGNWGDGERDDELRRFLLEPVARLGLNARVHGVRYPSALRLQLARNGVRYGGWLANHRVPEGFSRARVTVHIPRSPYVKALPGIPTIRMFEALACGIPLVSAPWDDVEGLFPAGSYLSARQGSQMTDRLSSVLRDEEFAMELAHNGLHAIHTRHTCRHRVRQLAEIIGNLGSTDLCNQISPRPDSKEMSLQ
jgi:spore maturation protein CgeB